MQVQRVKRFLAVCKLVQLSSKGSWLQIWREVVQKNMVGENNNNNNNQLVIHDSRQFYSQSVALEYSEKLWAFTVPCTVHITQTIVKRLQFR